jgi:hypothetical protein
VNQSPAESPPKTVRLPVVSRQGRWLRIDKFYVDVNLIEAVNFSTHEPGVGYGSNTFVMAIFFNGSVVYLNYSKETFNYVKEQLLSILGPDVMELGERQVSGGDVEKRIQPPENYEEDRIY